MPIEIRTGDLLEANVDALVNTVNCVGVMGKGIALQFKRRFPDNFRRYERACNAGEVRLGEMFVAPLDELGDRRWIVNFPTKGHWKAASRLSDIDSGLDALIRVIDELGIKSIALPPLGAGNGGLHWPDVERLIRAKFAAAVDVDVHLYAPAPGHRELHPAQVRMTWGRAALVRLLEAYAERRRAVEPWEDERGASALEIQKLMYFASLLEPKLRLRFSPGRYGPYSDQVRHLMQEMEGTFTVGFGDGADRVLELQPVVATREGSRRAREVATDDLDRDLIEPTLRLTEGFEGAYELELLASVHWVVANQGANDPAHATELVRAWTERKDRLFTDTHVGAAMAHLRHVRLIGSTA